MCWCAACRADEPALPRRCHAAPTKAGTLTDCLGYSNIAIIRPHRLSLLFRSRLRHHSIMVVRLTRLRIVVFALGAALTAGSMAACRRKDAPAPPVATPSVTLNHDRAPLGSPLDITYKFVVAPDAKFDEDYRVMVHVVDTDEEMIWNDDHNPPTPTKQWKPGDTIEYTRTIFVPI